MKCIAIYAYQLFNPQVEAETEQETAQDISLKDHSTCRWTASLAKPNSYLTNSYQSICNSEAEAVPQLYFHLPSLFSDLD